MSQATSSAGEKFVRTMPSPPNEASSAPFERYLTTANFRQLSVPATTMRPFPWIATDLASSPFPPAIGVTTVPPSPNVPSRSPSGSYRATANSPSIEAPAAAPTATIFPSACTATAVANDPTGKSVVS